MKNITDSHVHLDLIARNHPAKIQWLKENRCGVVSWAYLGRARSVPELEPGQVIGIHTPRSDKLSLTIATLACLDGFQDMSASIVVDHCTMETIGLVLEAGFRAGVTLSPAKTSWDELKQIVDRHGDQTNRIMCNTDSGSDFYDDVVRFQCNPDLPEVIRRKIFHLNAARFYSIPI